jgi:hypothetical protein
MIVQRVERFIAESSIAPTPDPADDAAFDALARDVFAFQVEHVEGVRRLAESRGVEPGSVTGHRQVPLVPTSAFKTMELAAAPPREVFRSSGTTRGPEHRSVHHHPYPDLYRQVIDASFPRYCLPHLPQGKRLPIVSLIPSREQQPDSSLSFMADHVLRRFGETDSSVWGYGPRRLDLGRVRSWLNARQRAGRPGVILATTLAAEDLLDGLERIDLKFQMPAGSVLFETGGSKGREREVSRSDLLPRVGKRLGLSPMAVVSEYGMTELTSQCYSPNILWRQAPDPNESPLLAAPPWVRVRILDPDRLEEVRVGTEGLVAVYDLANVGSALAVLTEDLGRREEHGFRVLGRVNGADLRGCSLTVEEMTAHP